MVVAVEVVLLLYNILLQTITHVLPAVKQTSRIGLICSHTIP